MRPCTSGRGGGGRTQCHGSGNVTARMGSPQNCPGDGDDTSLPTGPCLFVHKITRPPPENNPGTETGGGQHTEALGRGGGHRGGFEERPPSPAFPPLGFLPLWRERGRSRLGTSSTTTTPRIGDPPSSCPGTEPPTTKEQGLPRLEPTPRLGDTQGRILPVRGPPALQPHHMMKYFPPRQ